MKISVILDTGGAAAPGIDQAALAADIQAELDKLGQQVGATPTRKTTPAPKGAQGGYEMVQWLLDLASDPKMAPIYARALLFAVNQLIEAANSKKKDAGARKSSNDEVDKPPVKVKALGKEIMLPATVAAIQEFLKSIGDQG